MSCKLPAMHVVQIGNFEPPHSTENHLKRALQVNEHEVLALQENGHRLWENIGKDGHGRSAVDFVMWTRTPWDYTRHGYKSQEEALMLQLQFLNRMRKLGIPTVSYHLDLWHGLDREHQLDEPYFQTDLVITADGGHEDNFAKRGINHVWFPPGVSRAECEPGTFRDEFHSPIAFVGSWQNNYHRESTHRHELVAWLQQHYARDCAFWPKPGHNSVRGSDLRDLYASVDVVVGDSAFAGQIPNYWSDRIPETLGRGAYLLHPMVPGLETQFEISNRRPGIQHFSMAHLSAWEAGDWAELDREIKWALDDADTRRSIASHGRHHVLQHHTYERRMEQLVLLLREQDLL